MDKKALKEKLKLVKRDKRKNDRLLKIALLLIIVGYAFFFGTNYLLPKVYKTKDVVEPGTAINMEDYLVTLETWDYSEVDRQMEIIFNVDNFSLKSDVKYKCSLRENDKIYKADIHKKISTIEGEKVVVRVDKVSSRWAEVILSIKIENREINITMNDKKVHRVDGIKERTDKEYTIYAMQRRIEGMEAEIEKLDKQKEKLDGKIVAAYERLLDLEAKKANQTADEQKVADANISKMATDIESLKSDLDDTMYMIDECKEKIKNHQKLLKKVEQEK